MPASSEVKTDASVLLNHPARPVVEELSLNFEVERETARPPSLMVLLVEVIMYWRDGATITGAALARLLAATSSGTACPVALLSFAILTFG